jgi:preprotein translocase subunit SecF
MMRIIQKRKYFYVFSLVCTMASIAAVALWGLKLGIDFRGGTLMEARFSSAELRPENAVVSEKLAPLSLTSLSLQQTDNAGLILRYLASDEEANEHVLTILREFDPAVSQVRVDFIGASVSDQIKRSAILGVILSVVGIVLYIAWAFRRVSYPITSWEYGVGANIALLHDVLITIGAFAFLGRFYDIEVGVPFIAAILTILGYSVNDTIVVYDRIRENLQRERGKKTDFEDIVNRSLNETLGRSFNTSLTVLITLLAIVLFGGESIRYFALAILIGVGFGTYSSIFVASALMVTRYRMKMKQH